MLFNTGLSGKYYARMFGQRSGPPATLWNNKRRAACYAKAFQLLAQMPDASAVEDTPEWAIRICTGAGEGAKHLKPVVDFLQSTKTNYVRGGVLAGNVRNQLAKLLRRINPKSYGGATLKATNLTHLSDILVATEIVGKVTEVAFAASLRQALAGDVALARLDYMESVLLARQKAKQELDPAVLVGIKQARSRLQRDKYYWGAMLNELTVRGTDITRLRVAVVSYGIHKKLAPAMQKVLKAAHVKNAATVASQSAALWCWSLTLSVQMFSELLEQHEYVQVGIACTTVLDLLIQEAKSGRTRKTALLSALQAQAFAAYCDQMVRVFRGLLVGLFDLTHRGSPGKDVREAYTELRSRAIRQILANVRNVRVRDVKGIKTMTIDLGKGVKMKFALIPAGKFMMGSKLSAKEVAKRFGTKAEYYKYDHRQHQVTLSTPFYMGATEVTRGQFAAFVADSGYKTTAEKEGWAYAYDGKRLRFKVTGASWRKVGFQQTDSHPVVCVSWDDGGAFCRWLERKTGKSTSLPTEAQWEYACRAGTTTVFSFGDKVEELHKHANYCEKSCTLDLPWKDKDHDDGYRFTSPVGSYKPNTWGLYDMHGNVYEWCPDWYADSYANANARDPKGPATGKYRVPRGGSWINSSCYCRAANRIRNSPGIRSNNIGFRVLCSLSGVD